MLIGNEQLQLTLQFLIESLGKSSRAALENMYAQTSVLLDDLAETGGPGAFVTLQSVIDEIDAPRQGF